MIRMINNKNNDKKNKILFCIATILILIINTKITLSEIPTNPTIPIDISNIIIQENIKTRMELKQYCDQKTDSMIEIVKTQGQNFIGQNFVEFDKRIHETAQKLFIKTIIATFTTILLSLLTYYIIKRKIEKRHPPQAMHFREIPISPTKAGMIPQNPQKEIKPPIPRTQPPTLPTFPELRQPTIISPKEQQKIILEQQRIDEKRKKEAEKQLKKLIKEHNRNRKEYQKITKKLNKPETNKKNLEEEHTRVQQEIIKLAEELKIKPPPP